MRLAATMFLGLLLGLLGAAMRTSSIALFRAAATGYVEMIRNTPLKIRIADKVTVRYLLHTREWECYQLRTIRFLHSVRLLWLICPSMPEGSKLPMRPLLMV